MGRPRVATWLAVAGLLLVACNGGGPGNSPLDNPDVVQGEATATDQRGEEQLSELVAPPSVSFAVTFEWRDGTPAGDGHLVWRQGNGVRRWDIIRISSRNEESKAGEITIQSDFSPGAALGHLSLGCMWYTREDVAGQADVYCSDGYSPFLTLEGTLRADATAKLEDQAIAGRIGSCYSSQPSVSFKPDVEVFCVDSEGIPLLLVTKSQGDAGLSQMMRAVSVSEEEQSVVVPFELEPDPRTGYPDFDDTVPISELLLPRIPGAKE